MGGFQKSLLKSRSKIRTDVKGGGRFFRKVFLSFFLEDKTSAPDVFSSCSFIPCTLFETSSVVSCYGYEI